MYQQVKNLVEEIKASASMKAALTQERVQYKKENRPKLRQERAAVRTRRYDEEGQPPAYWKPLIQYERGLRRIDTERSNLKFEVRHALLALGYLRGRLYKQMEKKTRPGNEPTISKLHHYLVRFGSTVSYKELQEWVLNGASPIKRPLVEEIKESFAFNYSHSAFGFTRANKQIFIDTTTREVLETRDIPDDNGYYKGVSERAQIGNF